MIIIIYGLNTAAIERIVTTSLVNYSIKKCTVDNLFSIEIKDVLRLQSTIENGVVIYQRSEKIVLDFNDYENISVK